MPKARVPMLVADPFVCRLRGIECFEKVDVVEEFFLDGPVTRRVAVLDFDEADGTLRPGAKYVPPARNKKLGSYDTGTDPDPTTREIQAVSVFATVMKTIQMFEHPDVLGREVTWAFGAPQILVVPRAGDMANAYYDRDSHSLQFFYFTSANDVKVFGCASRDIVAHETTHAILDGIAPDLYHASTPQSLALHESIADMVALVSAFSSHALATSVLEETGGKIDQPSAFSMLAEEFGRERSGSDAPLRSLRNDKSLEPKAGDNFVGEVEPHELSEVLSGTLYAVVERLYTKWREKFEPSKALGIAADQFKRILLRSLDYLPAGEVSFADYGRAIIASDQAAYPDDAEAREVVVKEMVRRGIVGSAKALSVRTNFEAKELMDVDIATLASSDWAAYEFANRNRKLLRIPEEIHFRVLPRRDATRTYRQKGGEETRVRECIFKVSWDEKERNRLGAQFARERQITVGTTLAIDWETKSVRALLTSDFEEQEEARGELLALLASEGRLRVAREDDDLVFGRPLHADAVRVEEMDGLMRVRGTARMLHVTR